MTAFFSIETLDFFLKCVLLYTFIYLVVLTLTNFSLTFFIIPGIIHFFISKLCVPPTDEELVDQVLGINPRIQFRNEVSPESLRSTLERLNVGIAYRCAPFNYVHNDLNAVRKCAENNCKFIYVDVQYTVDNIAVITRGTKIRINRNDDAIEKPIDECTFNDIIENSTHDDYRDDCLEMIPTLTEILSLCESLELKAIINIIYSNYYTSTEPVMTDILNLFEENPTLYSNCIIASSNPYLLYLIRRKNRKFVTALDWQYVSISSVSTISWLKNRNSYCNELYISLSNILDSAALWLLNNFIHRIIGFSIIILPKHLITTSVVEHWETRKIRCIASIVNLPVEKDYYKKALGISYLTEVLDSAET